MDFKGSLFGTLSGTNREVLHKLTVNLPHKFARGGQMALRFPGIRKEKYLNYLKKTAELATQFYIDPVTSQPNVFGLILVGLPGFVTERLIDMFDPRLKAKILKVADVSYGGEIGFDTAVELSAEFLFIANVFQ